MQDEKKILRQCKRGNRKAQRMLVDVYSKHLYNVCYRYTREGSLAKDCLQESWILIFQNLGTYTAGGNFRGWITVIAVRKTLEIMRKYSTMNWQEIDDGQQPMRHEDVHHQLELQDVNHFIESLDDKYRIVINMYLVEGFSHKEIATYMNIKESTSRSLLTRAKKMIQENFESMEQYEQRNTDPTSRLSITHKAAV